MITPSSPLQTRQSATCPMCGAIVTVADNGYTTPRHRMRNGVRRHIISQHPELGPREASQVADQIVAEAGFT